MPAIPARDSSPAATPSHTAEDPKTPFPTPLTLLEIRDLSSDGGRRFLRSVDASTILQDAIETVHKILTPKQEGTPNVRSITLVIRDFPGVAYTTGKDIDFEHKEIHVSTDYIAAIDEGRLKHEITGVLVHEMVHVWQWNGRHSCNGGLIEGIADWVRLKADLGPPHWRRRYVGCDWDAGYEVTGYYLDWLEKQYGSGLVVRMNQRLRLGYAEEILWKELCDGEDVKVLWTRYGLALADEGRKGSKANGGPAPALPTEGSKPSIPERPA